MTRIQLALVSYAAGAGSVASLVKLSLPVIIVTLVLLGLIFISFSDRSKQSNEK